MNQIAELRHGEEVFLMLRAHRLLTSRSMAAVLDETSEAELHHYLSQGVLRESGIPVTDAGRALSVAPLYVLGAVPHLAEFDVDLLVGWREELADSLAAYRSAVVRDAVFEFFAKSQQLSGGTFRIELHDVAATDEHAIALQINRAERNGKTLEARVVGVYHLRAGKASEAWFLTDTQDENDEFWS